MPVLLGYDLFYRVALCHYVRDLRAADDSTAETLDLRRHHLIELTGTLFRVGILLDERGLDLAAGFFEGLGKEVPYGFHKGQPLDSLRAPVGGDVLRIASPQLLGIALEEHFVKRLTETVYVKIAERVFFFLADRRFEIAEACLYRPFEAHIAEGRGL